MHRRLVRRLFKIICNSVSLFTILHNCFIFRTLSPFPTNILANMASKYPKSARPGLCFLLVMVYTEKFLLLHRKSDTKAKTGEDLKVAVVEKQIASLQGSMIH